MRMLNCEYNVYVSHPQIDLHPLSLCAQIDFINEKICINKLESIHIKQPYIFNNENMIESDFRASTNVLIQFSFIQLQKHRLLDHILHRNLTMFSTLLHSHLIF